MYKDASELAFDKESVASICGGIIALRMYGKALQEAGVKVPGYQKAREQIIEYRDTYGGFLYIDELLNVNGIGEKLLKKIKPYITL